MKRIVQNIKTKKIEKSEHFLRRPYEKKNTKDETVIILICTALISFDSNCLGYFLIYQ